MEDKIHRETFVPSKWVNNTTIPIQTNSINEELNPISQLVM